MDDHQRRLLLALAEKYRQMHRMRGEADTCDQARARSDMAQLAARFPGALRELDELPLALLVERERSIDDALRTGVPERWMLLQASYHGFMRAVLRLRRELRPHGQPSRHDLAHQAVLRSYVPAADEPGVERFGPTELHVIAHPPGGRLNPWVIEQVAREHGTSAEEVHRALFRSLPRAS